jgi:predicted DNA-binding ribbon-helix-helix protein
MKSGRARGVRFDRWIHDVIEEIAQEKGLTFTDVVNVLLGSELEYMGYSKSKYNVKKYGLGRGTSAED